MCYHGSLLRYKDKQDMWHLKVWYGFDDSYGRYVTYM